MRIGTIVTSPRPSLEVLIELRALSARASFLHERVFRLLDVSRDRVHYIGRFG